MSNWRELKTVVNVPGEFKRVNVREDGTVEIISLINFEGEEVKTEEEKKTDKSLNVHLGTMTR